MSRNRRSVGLKASPAAHSPMRPVGPDYRHPGQTSLLESRPDMIKLEWNDLRYILAVANEGSLAGAARRLRVNHTTVLRRVEAFEKRIGLRLFERLPAGYLLTAGGEELVAAARSIDDTVTA